ncbi:MULTISPECIES: UDP-N-acetylmuramate dehydrogenase [Micromonospora]|uniref:UDP-N-acetylenolpyruvoylglucosamine reductase n=1 Tax=Micromonospora solifontis TaxID=2487138 RepID=A0ABX9WLJ6_9ACTN|nr:MULTISPECIES: UDP-N-acetylmuramate dehydrogenase [Micromonospora]NES15647.1 UDP-N-acetylmuramate dehydrogenase [Micromonospora sp. PPF5-17B]NES35947.1 UDP-N-acetylmuramate dehydrogenase [Micromonospora solifontis]NES56980.1 UDP-N-acetylmuramate dehydrogenase [Micromonospora sp. PPF5-6]RNM00055.1 UDP-N-acetylmuramate dehydrogenase [Micromonospora solifontis]
MSDVYAEPATGADPTDPATLARYTTLRLGGAAGRLETATSADEIVQKVREAQSRDEPVLVLAGGSNVVIGDQGFPGTVVLIRSRGFRVVAEDADTVTVRVEAGEPWDDLVAATVERGWSGLECLSGVPGSAGATPIQNVGAYGQEVAETITAVEAYDRTHGAVVRIEAADCGFAYRGSIFKYSDRWVVLTVDFRLTRSPVSGPVRYAELARALGVEVGDRVPLADARATVLRLRAGKGMVLDADDPDTRSVGSFFTNPVLESEAYELLQERAADLGEPPHWSGAGDVVKVSAAWLIDKAGFGKGYAGPDGVAISSKHTLALTNRSGTAPTAALVALAREIRDGVHDRFGVTLHPEPVLINCTI